jgi:hypothetical protein
VPSFASQDTGQGLWGSRPLQRPKRVRDETYNAVFEALMTQNIMQMLKISGRCSIPAFRTAMRRADEVPPFVGCNELVPSCRMTGRREGTGR